MVFYIESNGFCGTQWLSQCLSQIPGVFCYHGTRALPSGRPLGSDSDLEAEAFAAELARESAARNMTIGAIHSKFGPNLRRYIKRERGHYALAVRHPITRVNSCSAWAVAKAEAGFRLPLASAAAACTSVLKLNFLLSDSAPH